MASGGMVGGRARAAWAIAAVAAVIAAAFAWWMLPHASPSAPANLATPPAPPPPPPWTLPQLRDLLAVARQADGEGLRATDYQVDALRDAIDAGRTGAGTDALADGAAAALAHDFAAGRIRNRHRFNWYIDYAGPDGDARAAAIRAARQDGRLRDYLTGLLPDARQYRALRDALAATGDDALRRRDRIRANMERWRWLPRGFGDGGDRLYVNLPTYRLEVIEGGARTASYRAVIGATDMPTPVLSAAVRQVIVNPDWIVPMSIVRKSHLRPGASSRYVFTTRPDGTLRVRQKPGAGNALGKVKIEFPNALAIYFHDTPARSLFGESVRTFSHGCVRVQDIAGLAGTLVARRDRYDTAMAGGQTRSFPVSRPWRADIVYLTMVADADGAIDEVGDPYGMDDPIAAALDGRTRPKPPPPVTPPPTPTPAAAPVAPAAPVLPTVVPDIAATPDPVPENGQ